MGEKPRLGTGLKAGDGKWPLRVQDLREGPGREAEWGAGLLGPEGRAGQGPGRSLCMATVSMEVMRPTACQLVLCSWSQSLEPSGAVNFIEQLLCARPCFLSSCSLQREPFPSHFFSEEETPRKVA